ncbi:MAG TPA: hypothetical protein VFM06_07675 [Candidatus Limnocylindria bacterium]|nr:hypothetical protein [Candidatus Limnocylindria bacterium]
MAITTVAAFNSPSPRRTAAASANRMSPRVYSPFPSRRLARPMAVRAGAEDRGVAPGRTRLPFFRGRRERSV